MYIIDDISSRCDPFKSNLGYYNRLYLKTHNVLTVSHLLINL